MKLIISIGSCNGQESEFEKWMNENYPEIETVIENTMDGGLFEWSESYQEWIPIFDQDDYWDRFCRCQREEGEK